MITLLLARHGQASFGQENYDQLSELGVVQAKRLGEHYGSTQRRIDAIFSGSLVRQRDSAEHFYQAYRSVSNHDLGIKPIFDKSNPESCVLPIFNEFNHEDVFVKSNPTLSTQAQIAAELNRNNQPISRLGKLFGQAMQRWHAGEHDDEYLESWPQFSARAVQGLEELRNQVDAMHNLNADSLDADSTVLVFTSGGVIAAITAHLLKQSSATAYQLTQSSVNTGVTSLVVQQQKLQLLSYNEHSHLFSKGKSLITKH